MPECSSRLRWRTTEPALPELDHVDKYIPGLTNQPAWPTLRAHLIDRAAETGKHPLRYL